MNNKTRKLLVIVVVIVQMMFFAGWYSAESDVFAKPIKQITVKTVSYDPRDLLSGQYIRLNYDFSSTWGRWDNETRNTIYPEWAKKMMSDDKNGRYSRKKQEVWVVLHEVNGLYEPKQAYYEKPENLSNSEVVIRGVKKYNSISYGIERYFVPEGTKEPNRNDTTVQLNLYDNGRIRINKVLVKGQEWP